MAERSLKLEIRDMTKRYDNGDGVEHINLKIYEGEIVTMLGPSGCVPCASSMEPRKV